MTGIFNSKKLIDNTTQINKFTTTTQLINWAINLNKLIKQRNNCATRTRQARHQAWANLGTTRVAQQAAWVAQLLIQF